MLLLSRFKIIGHSMEPTIYHGDSVLVSGLPYIFSKPGVGDIALCFSKVNKKNFVKRISSISEKGYFLKGDNTQDSLDSRKFGVVGRKEILGKVIKVLPSFR